MVIIIFDFGCGIVGVDIMMDPGKEESWERWSIILDGIFKNGIIAIVITVIFGCGYGIIGEEVVMDLENEDN